MPETLRTMETLPGERSSDDGGGSGELGPLLVKLIDCADLSVAPARFRLRRFETVVIRRSRAPGIDVRPGSLELTLTDPYASSKHARIRWTGDSWTMTDEGSTNGTFKNGGKLAIGQASGLADGDVLEIGRTFFLFRTGARGHQDTPEILDLGAPGAILPLTLQPEWEQELQKAQTLARGEHEILIQGESGAGKEVLARLLHQRSRPDGPLVSVNCGALAENLLEDELFGHVRGAFSGAQTEREGLIRAAEGGTLLLDEVGDMPPVLQVKLLRVLEDHRVRPIGSEREQPVDVRVLAATHRDLDAMVAEGKFRHDLLARLGLLPIRVPALRERRDDLGLLIREVLRASPGGLEGLRIDLETMRLLVRYRWPLNVRELGRTLQAAAALARAEGKTPATILPRHLPESIRGKGGTPASPAVAPQPGAAPPASLPPTSLPGAPPPGAEPQKQRPPQPPPRELDAAELQHRDQLLEVLQRHGGNISAVARELGKARMQIQRWIARYGINVDEMRGPGDAEE